MGSVYLRNPMREAMELAYKDVLKKYGFKYNKEICSITKKFSKGTMRVSYDYDSGVLIGWSILIWVNSKTVYEDVFLKSDDFDKNAFDIAYNKAKAFLRNYK